MYDSFDITSIKDIVEVYTTGILADTDCWITNRHNVPKSEYSVDKIKQLLLEEHTKVDPDEFIKTYDTFRNSFGGIPKGLVDKQQIKMVLKKLMHKDVLDRCRYAYDGSYLNNRIWLQRGRIICNSRYKFEFMLGTEFYSYHADPDKTAVYEHMHKLSVPDKVQFIIDNFEIIWLMMPSKMDIIRQQIQAPLDNDSLAFLDFDYD